MPKSTSLRAVAGTTLVAAGALMAATAMASTGAFKEGVDVDGSGDLSVEEFVMAQGERAMAMRDTNDDGRLSSAEWLGQNQGSFQQLTLDRFNVDGDDFMSAGEIVEVFSWVFGNRDKNKDGKLSVDETPNFLLNK